MKKFIEERIAVKCETRGELNVFLERCEKEGLKWVCQSKATKFTPPCNPTYMTYGFSLKGCLEFAGTCSHLEKEGWKVVTYKEYFGKPKYKVGDIVETEFGKGEIKDFEEGHLPYLVYHYDWDRGHNNFGQYTGGHCWFFKEEEIKLATEQEEQITITRLGGHKVVAKYGEKVGVAKCNPEDEFNFETGAKLAFERLFGTEVKEVKRAAKVGEYIKIIDAYRSGGLYKNGDILKVKKLNELGNVSIKDIGIYQREYVVLEGYKPTDTESKKESFKPHLSGFGKNYGYIGEEVGFTDVLLKDLYVGDIVELYDVEGREWVGKYFVCKQNGRGFVMSVAASNFKDGESTNLGKWRIKKVKSYKDFKHGEVVDKIRVILKDEK